MTWEPISTAPRDGTRIRLGHEQDQSSMRVDAMCKTYGSFDGGRWMLSSFFTIPGGRYGLLSESPTHWLPDPHPPIAVGDSRNEMEGGA